MKINDKPTVSDNPRYPSERPELTCIIGAVGGGAAGLVGGLFSGSPEITILATLFGASAGCGVMAATTESDYQRRMKR